MFSWKQPHLSNLIFSNAEKYIMQAYGDMTKLFLFKSHRCVGVCIPLTKHKPPDEASMPPGYDLVGSRKEKRQKDEQN